MSGLEVVAALAGLAGTGLQIAGTLEQGQEEKRRFEYQAKVRKQQGDEAMASSQRDAQARNREVDLIMSRQRAAVAGAGGSTADQSVLDVMGDTAKEGNLGVRTELYKGDQQQRGYDDAATVARYDAAMAPRRAALSAAGTLFSGTSSMYSRFGQQQKKTAPASTVQLPYG